MNLSAMTSRRFTLLSRIITAIKASNDFKIIIIPISFMAVGYAETLLLGILISYSVPFMIATILTILIAMMFLLVLESALMRWLSTIIEKSPILIIDKTDLANLGLYFKMLIGFTLLTGLILSFLLLIGRDIDIGTPVALSVLILPIAWYTFENMIAYIIMFFIKRGPRPGDEVEINGRRGTVEGVGLFSTRVKFSLGEVLIIPNGVLLSKALILREDPNNPKQRIIL